MNLGKLSGLKGLVSHSSGKRRLKGDLTPDMISPPLGDFRHTMHVGRGGDVFGDTSFLSNHGGAGNAGDGDSITASEKSEGFFSRTLRHVRKTPGKDLSPPPPPISPIIKNAISLPRLDIDLVNGSPMKMPCPSTSKPPEASVYSYGIDSGFVTLPKMSRTDRPPQGSPPSGCSTQVHCSSLTDMVITSHFCSDTLTLSDSITSFSIDLGPSLMSEVFAMFDNKVSKVEHKPEAHFALASKAEMGLDATTSLVDSLLREVSEGRSCMYSETSKRPMIGPGDCMQSYSAEEHDLGAERFQTPPDVLACHYGTGTPKNTDMNCSQNRRPYIYLDEEEEIKV